MGPLLGLALAAAPFAGAADQTVTVASDTFTPRDVTVAVGEKVTWTNSGGLHNVRFNDGSYEMPAMPDATAWTRERTFSTAGTFRYYCREHGTATGGMSGTVTVTAAQTPAPGDPSPGPGPGSPPPGGGPAPDSPIDVEVTLKLSDSTPRAGRAVRFFGSVTPALDGRSVQIQRRTRGGAFQTVAKAALRDAGDRLSRYSRRIRVSRDAVFRARLAADGGYSAGTSARKRVNVR